MSDGGDAVSVLRWGLRRYLFVVVLCVALGALAPQFFVSPADRYEARAQVGPDGRLLLPNLDPLPRLGESVFDNGAVADAVRRSVDPRLPESTDVVPDVVELVAPQDNVVFTIVGHARSPETAVQFANVAARAFALELDKYADSVGSFRTQQLAVSPAAPVPEAEGPLLVAVGLGTGLLLGLGLVVLLLVLRQPVIDLPTAERLTGAKGLGRIRFSGGSNYARGLPGLCRAVIAEDIDMLLLTGPRNTRRDRARLASELTDVLSGTTSVFLPSGMNEVNRVRLRPEPQPGIRGLTVVLEPSELELTTRPTRSRVVLVVREGVASAAMHRHAEQYGPGVGVVLVKRHLGRPPRAPRYPGQDAGRDTGDHVGAPLNEARRSRV
jgi:hypothetical protein